jgi:DNA polymerase III delta prime subunit
MKFNETYFDDYINQDNLLHSKLHKLYDNFPSDLKYLKNIIFYGPRGVGKYTQMLYAIKKYSPSELKYEKKISINFNKVIYYFKISDIHYEIDMSLLGCQSKLLWNEIFHQIIDIILSTKSNNSGIIVCKYFNEIHNELLEIFYSYMQTLFNTKIYIKFILLTEDLSFIPDNIYNCCQIINVERPSKNTYLKCIKHKNNIPTELSEIYNIKNLKSQIFLIDSHITICNQIIEQIINYNNLNFHNLREIIYNIFIYNINIYECIWYILQNLIHKNLIKLKDFNKLLTITYTFFQYYNNNYRPIYHLESYLFNLIKIINEF